MYVLDSNSLIYFFKGMGGVADRLLSTPPADIAISTVVLYEIEVGIAKSSSPRKRQAQLDSFLGYATILPFGQKEAAASATIRADLEKRGLPIGPLDNLIAGTAFSHGAILVTNNVHEFGRIERLKIENWF
jgi:tRNA(fMet)-specific endonuclease VapC